MNYGPLLGLAAYFCFSVIASYPFLRYDMLTFELHEAVNVVIGGVVGAIAGWITTHIYYSKGWGAQKLQEWFAREASAVMLSAHYPRFFASPTAYRFPVPAPTKQSVPSLWEVIFEAYPASHDSETNIALRVHDDGWDFPTERGLKVSSASTASPIFVSRIGFGFMQIKVPPLPRPGQYELTFEMQDLAGHKNVQSISFIAN